MLTSERLRYARMMFYLCHAGIAPVTLQSAMSKLASVAPELPPFDRYSRATRIVKQIAPGPFEEEPPLSSLLTRLRTLDSVLTPVPML
jgi:hypothetical protein